MTMEFMKGTKDKADVCYLLTHKITSIDYPLWVTKENFEEIKKIMDW